MAAVTLATVDPMRMHAAVSRQPTATDRRPLLVLHGLGMSSRYLAPTTKLLARHHRVYSPDLPGSGRSSRPRRVLAMPELADAVVAWMDIVGLDRPPVIGHSIGCQVAVHLAERHPCRVDRLVLVSPTGDPSARRWQLSKELLVGSVREAPSLITVAISDYVRAGPVRMWRSLGLAMETDTVERLQRISHPCLVVRGEHDRVVTAAWASSVARLVGDGRLCTLPGAPHGVPFSAAPALVAVVLPFVAS